MPKQTGYWKPGNKPLSLSRRTRARGDLAHLRQALVKGLESGMTVNEVNEVLIHAYAYCGFPRSLRAIQTFMQVIEEKKHGN